ncbi:MAG: hypothetical protein ACC683_07520, partial [Acidimicrobiia bacterium]
MFIERKLVGLMGVVALVAAACSSATGGAEFGAGDTPSTTATTVPITVAPGDGVLPEGPSALDNRFDDSFPEPLIDPGDILSGGP